MLLRIVLFISSGNQGHWETIAISDHGRFTELNVEDIVSLLANYNLL